MTSSLQEKKIQALAPPSNYRKKEALQSRRHVKNPTKPDSSIEKNRREARGDMALLQGKVRGGGDSRDWNLG